MINPPNLTKKTTLITFCFLLASLTKLAQSSLQSDTPKWLSHTTSQTKQNHSVINALDADDKLNNLYTNIYVDNKNHHLIVTKDYNIEIKKVEILNILGKLMHTWKIDEHADSYLLELEPRLPAGVYLTKITTNKGINNKKIIVE